MLFRIRSPKGFITHDKSHLRLFARTVQKVPWLVALGRIGWRLRQPRFTMGVVGVVFNADGAVLLVEHVLHPKTPWGLPGGWIDNNESPAHAAMREFNEELGMRIAVERIVLAELTHRYHVDFAYLCRQESDIKTLSSELLDYRWCHIDTLPALHPFHKQAIVHACEDCYMSEDS